jgi:hypothetical protein
MFLILMYLDPGLMKEKEKGICINMIYKNVLLYLLINRWMKLYLNGGWLHTKIKIQLRILNKKHHRFYLLEYCSL